MTRPLLRAAFVLSLAACAAGPALAQGARGAALVAPTVAPPPSEAPAGRLFTVGIGKSQLVHLARPARDVLVASPGVADVVLKSPDMAFIVGHVAGETTVYFFDAEGRQIDALDVTVLFDTTALEDALRHALPNEQIEVSTVNTGVVLSGAVSSQQVIDDAVAIATQFVALRTVGTSNTATVAPTAAGGSATTAATSTTTAASSAPTSIINLLKVRNENQVLLRVRVSEMSRAVVKELGVSPGAVFNNFRLIGGASGLSTTNVTVPGFGAGGIGVGGAVGPGPGASFGGAGAAFPATVTPYGGFGLTIPFGAATGLTALIEALDSNGLVKTLAEPNLTAVSGETASFLVGGSVPICQTTTTANGLAQFSFIYKPFGIQLTFTPIVMSNNLISVRITAELSTLVTSAAGGAIIPSGLVTCGAPAFTNRNVTTTVELPSGGSIALAGLLQNDDTSNIQGLPGFKDIPVLGTLFSSKAYQENLDDLVITVTTLLAKPAAPGELAYPTDGFGPASDFNFYIMNRLQSHYAPAAGAIPPAQVKSTFGLILE